MSLTPKEYAEVGGDQCPACHSSTVVPIGPGPGNEVARATRRLRCNDCRSEWLQLLIPSGYADLRLPKKDNPKPSRGDTTAERLTQLAQMAREQDYQQAIRAAEHELPVLATVAAQVPMAAPPPTWANLTRSGGMRAPMRTEMGPSPDELFRQLLAGGAPR